MSYIEKMCCVNWRFRSFVQYIHLLNHAVESYYPLVSTKSYYIAVELLRIRYAVVFFHCGQCHPVRFFVVKHWMNLTI